MYHEEVSLTSIRVLLKVTSRVGYKMLWHLSELSDIASTLNLFENFPTFALQAHINKNIKLLILQS